MPTQSEIQPDVVAEVEALLAKVEAWPDSDDDVDFEVVRRLVEEVKAFRRFTAEVAELGCLRGRHVHCVEREPHPADWCVACRAKGISSEKEQPA